MDSTMEEDFDSLTVLLQLLSLGRSVDQQSALFARLNPEQWDALVSEAYRQNLASLLFSFLSRQPDTQVLPLPLCIDRRHR